MSLDRDPPSFLPSDSLDVLVAESDAAFRRALRTYAGLTPMQVRALGGLNVVLERFLDACGLRDSVLRGRSVA